MRLAAGRLCDVSMSDRQDVDSKRSRYGRNRMMKTNAVLGGQGWLRMRVMRRQRMERTGSKKLEGWGEKGSWGVRCLISMGGSDEGGGREALGWSLLTWG